MDNPRHRQTLRALRPHGADRLEPEAQSALAAAREDPVLGAWFTREQAFDQGFAERIQSVRAPEDLRASIVAAVERAHATRTTRPAPRRWLMRRPIATTLAALAAAASLALLAVVLWPRQIGPVAVEDVIAAAVETPPAAFVSTELAGRPLSEVRDWLAGQAAPVPGEIPSAVAALPVHGATVIEVRGVTTSVVSFDATAFGRDDASGAARRIALFTLPRQSCSTAGITRDPVVREQAGRAVAVWRDATSIYVLAVEASPEALRQFLAGGRLVTANAWPPGSHPDRGKRSNTTG